MTTWTFNGDYKDLEQARPFLDAFKRRLADLESRGEYRYNNSFKGHLDADVDDRTEDTLIYLCQKLERDDRYQSRYAELLAEGFVSLPDTRDGQLRKFAVVVDAHRACTEFLTYESARVLDNARGFRAIIPKGKRTHGHYVKGEVLVKP